MKLVTFEALGVNRVGWIVGEEVVDLTSASPDLEDMVDLIGRVVDGADLDEIGRDAERRLLGEVRLLAPIPRPRKNVIAVGRNYRDRLTPDKPPDRMERACGVPARVDPRSSAAKGQDEDGAGGRPR